jgi:hypothetical protein
MTGDPGHVVNVVEVPTEEVRTSGEEAEVRLREAFDGIRARVEAAQQD